MASSFFPRLKHGAERVLPWLAFGACLVAAWLAFEHLPALYSLPSPLVNTPLVPFEI